MDFSAERELRGLAETIGPIARRAEQLGIPWLLIGAAARDVLLQYVRGWPPSRRTEDADVAVLVRTWEELSMLRELLVREEGAHLDDDVKQRVTLPAGNVDVVPCGGIERDGAVAWPPDGDPRLDVHGLREAFAGAQRVTLPGPLVVPVVAVHHYVCLKLLAWRDRHHRKPLHDAVDLADLLQRAGELFELDVLYREHASEMEAAEFDPARAALRVLGRRLGETLTPAARAALEETLRSELDEDGRLELLRELRGVPDANALLCGLLQGIEGS